jgi:predicted porin
MTRPLLPLGALAAAALLSLPAAAQVQATPPASVTIYGLFDAANRHATNTTAAGESRRTMEDGIFTGSRLGWRGREPINAGLAAVFTMEAGFDPSTGGSLQGTAVGDFGQATVPTRFFGREIHLGLRGKDGGFTIGRNYTLAHSLAARFQPQGNPNSTAHSLFSSHHIARQDNIVRADVKVGDVELHGGYTFGEQPRSSANSSTAMGVAYAKGSLQWAAYVQQMKNLSGAETRRVVGLGGNYRVNPTVQLFGGAMQRSDKVSPQENRAWTLGANIEVGKQSTLSIAHYDDDQSGSAALNGARQVTWVTANYRFSRRTDIYAVVDRNRVVGGYARPAFMGRLGTQNGVVLGVRHRF